jgi:hypothetical protein
VHVMQERAVVFHSFKLQERIIPVGSIPCHGTDPSVPVVSESSGHGLTAQRPENFQQCMAVSQTWESPPNSSAWETELAPGL